MVGLGGSGGAGHVLTLPLLPVPDNEVAVRWGIACSAQHRGDLPPVVAPVIHHVQYNLPDGHPKGLTLQIAMRNQDIQIFGSLQPPQPLRVDFPEGGQQVRNVPGSLIVGDQRLFIAENAVQPDQLGQIDVLQGFQTRGHISGDRLAHTFIGPFHERQMLATNFRSGRRHIGPY